MALSSVRQSRAVTSVSCYLADVAGPTAVSHVRLAAGSAGRGAPANSMELVASGVDGWASRHRCTTEPISTATTCCEVRPPGFAFERILTVTATERQTPMVHAFYPFLVQPASLGQPPDRISTP
jgi:hypothetical protein